jgi:hypothetical protein
MRGDGSDEAVIVVTLLSSADVETVRSSAQNNRFSSLGVTSYRLGSDDAVLISETLPGWQLSALFVFFLF